MMDGMMEAPEQETTCVCPNCGATLKLEVEQPEEASVGGPPTDPSIRDALAGAMGNGAA